MRHRYLFTLEVTPVEVGKMYKKLPSHLTLMSRFFSDLSPVELSKVTTPLFDQTRTIQLVFKETVELGPKKLAVHLLEQLDESDQLHNALSNLLNSINVIYEYPEFIGKNYKPHVTMRDGVQFDVHDKHAIHYAYLVEIIEGQRVVQAKFRLTA